MLNCQHPQDQRRVFVETSKNISDVEFTRVEECLTCGEKLLVTYQDGKVTHVISLKEIDAFIESPKVNEALVKTVNEVFEKTFPPQTVKETVEEKIVDEMIVKAESKRIVEEAIDLNDI